MANIWSLSGIDTARWNIRKGSSWRPPVQVRTKNLDVPSMHGVIAVGLPVFEMPQVNLSLRCGLGNQETVEEISNELIGLVAAPGLTLGRDSGGIVTEAIPRFVSANLEEFIWNHSARFNVLFDIPGVFFRQPAVTTDPVVVTDEQTVVLPGLGVGTAPITDSIVRFSGPLTTVVATDPVSGTYIRWTGMLPGGTYLFMSPSTMKAWTSTTASLWDGPGTNVSGGLSRGPSGMLQIWPKMAALDPSVRQSRITVTGAGFSGATTMAVRAQPAYL